MNPLGNGYTYKLVYSVVATSLTVDESPWVNGKEHHTRNSLKYLNNITVNTSASTSNVNTTGFKAMDIRTAKEQNVVTANDQLIYNSDGYALVKQGNINYLVFDVGEHCHIDSDVNVLVYAYEAGELVGVKAL